MRRDVFPFQAPQISLEKDMIVQPRRRWRARLAAPRSTNFIALRLRSPRRSLRSPARSMGPTRGQVDILSKRMDDAAAQGRLPRSSSSAKFHLSTDVSLPSPTARDGRPAEDGRLARRRTFAPAADRSCARCALRRRRVRFHRRRALCPSVPRLIGALARAFRRSYIARDDASCAALGSQLVVYPRDWRRGLSGPDAKHRRKKG